MAGHAREPGPSSVRVAANLRRIRQERGLSYAELARRLAGSGVTVNCFHPGFVATRFGDETGGLISFSTRIGKRFALSPQRGAETLIYLASSSEVANTTGRYFSKCHPVQPSREAQDDTLAGELWRRTASLSDLPD